MSGKSSFWEILSRMHACTTSFFTHRFLLKLVRPNRFMKNPCFLVCKNLQPVMQNLEFVPFINILYILEYLSYNSSFGLLICSMFTDSVHLVTPCFYDKIMQERSLSA